MAGTGRGARMGASLLPHMRLRATSGRTESPPTVCARPGNDIGTQGALQQSSRPRLVPNLATYGSTMSDTCERRDTTLQGQKN